MFSRKYRIIEKQKDGKTVYYLQDKFFWFWWTLSDPIEDKVIAEGLKILFEYRDKKMR